MFEFNSSCSSAGVFAVAGRLVTFDAGRSTNLDSGRARPYCACSRCGWGLFGYIFSPTYHFSFSFSLSLEWMDVSVLFNRILVISGRWVGDGWLYAMEFCLKLRKCPPQTGLESGTAGLAG